jgi:hypothetical protein
MYLDPSEGKIGAFLDTVYGAATSGALKVDPKTGEATLKFLNDIQDLVDAMGRQSSAISVQTPLGGGFGEKIGEFNRQLAAGDTSCAQDVLERFSRELELLKNAVSMSMQSYAGMDSDNARVVAAAGSGQ